MPSPGQFPDEHPTADILRRLAILEAAARRSPGSALRMERITTAQSIPNGANTVVVFNSTVFEVDDTGRITPNTSTGVVTVNEAGIYRITAGAEFVSNTTGRRILFLVAAGLVVAEHDDSAPSVTATCGTCISTLVKLAAADTIDARVFQLSGGALDVSANTKTHMTVEWDGPAV